jgi:NADP-dependent 3-hydroxy acid dehydrogenase YdfG
VGALAGMGAVVVGAGSGVGRAIALALAEEGVVLAVGGRDLEALGEVCGHAGSAFACPLDLEQEDQIADFAARATEQLPGVDVLVHAAGTIEIDPVEAATLDDFDVQYRTNLRGPYALTQALLPALRSSRGQVIFINSTASRGGRASSSQYAATKAGVTAVANSLRAEVNGDGVRVLDLLLGRTATPLQARLKEAEGEEYRPECMIQPEDVADVVIAALKLRRTAEITDLALRPMQKPFAAMVDLTVPMLALGATLPMG